MGRPIAERIMQRTGLPLGWGKLARPALEVVGKLCHSWKLRQEQPKQHRRPGLAGDLAVVVEQRRDRQRDIDRDAGTTGRQRIWSGRCGRPSGGCGQEFGWYMGFAHGDILSPFVAH